MAVVWRWLVDWWPNLVTAVGLTFTVWGIALAWTAAVEDYRTFEGQPLFPWLAAVASWLRRYVFRQRREPIVVSGTASATFSSTATLTGTARVEVPPDAPVEQQVQYLRKQVTELRADLGSVSGSVGQVEQRVGQRIKEVHDASQRRDDELHASVRRVATGTVKRELKGLLLVGLGSFIGAIPSLFG